MKFSKHILFAIILLSLLSFNSVQAQKYIPIVQCGTSTTADCTTCDFVAMVKRIIDMIIYLLTPILATAFFIYAGFLMLLSGANPNLFGQAKKIFTQTVYGVVIVLLAWVITNTFIQTFGPPNAANSWFEFSCPAGLP